MNKIYNTISITIFSIFAVLSCFFAPIANAEEISPLTESIETPMALPHIESSVEPILQMPIVAPLGTAHVSETEKTTQSANVNVVESSTNISNSTEATINTTISSEIDDTSSQSTIESINDATIIQTNSTDEISQDYTDGSFVNNVATPIHDLEFITAPVYYSSECACSHEDNPTFPHDNSSPLTTQSALLNVAGLTLIPVIGDIVAAVLLPSATINLNLLVIALFGNIMMLLLRSYLRLRSGRSPGYMYTL